MSKAKRKRHIPVNRGVEFESPAAPSPREYSPRMRRLHFIVLFLLAANLNWPAFPPYDQHWLAWFAFVPFFMLLDRCQRLRSQLLVTMLYATWGYAMGYSWIAPTMVEFAKFDKYSAFGVLVLFCLLGSTCFLPFVILRHLWFARARTKSGERGDRRGGMFLIAGLWLAMECWSPRLFPWFIGLTQHSVGIVRQLADLGSVYAVGLPVILTNLLIYELWLLRRTRTASAAVLAEAFIALLVILLALGYGAMRQNHVQELLVEAEAAGGGMRVALVQANVPNDLKSEVEGTAATGDIPPATEDYIRLTLAAMKTSNPPELVIWPETAWPHFVTMKSFDLAEVRRWPAEQQGYIASWSNSSLLLRKVAEEGRVTMLVGGLEAEGLPAKHGGEINYNAAIAVNARGLQATYRKRVLIPFGEAVPAWIDSMFPWIAERMPRSFKFSPGAHQWPLVIHGRPVAITICYEAILEGFVRDAVVRGKADMLVNLTNDSWFGDTGEPAQHLALSSFRAIEMRVPFLRSTNSGITAYIDPNGKIHDPIPYGRINARLYTVPRLTITGKTVFSYVGLFPVHLIAVIAVVFVLGRVLRSRRMPLARADVAAA